MPQMIAHGRLAHMPTAATTKCAAIAALLFSAREQWPDEPVCRSCGLSTDLCRCPDGPDAASAGYRAAVEELAFRTIERRGDNGAHLHSAEGRAVLWGLMTDAALEAEVPGYAALVDARQAMEVCQ